MSNNTEAIKQNKFQEIGFIQGVVWACARLIELFDQPAMALNILRESGLKDLKVAAEYDLAILREEDPSIPYGYDAEKYTCEFCGEQFFYEEDLLAHRFNSPCEIDNGDSSDAN